MMHLRNGSGYKRELFGGGAVLVSSVESWRKVTVFFALILLFPSIGFTQSEQTNLELLTEVITKLVDRSIERVGLVEKDTVVVFLGQPQQPVPVFLGTLWLENLKNKTVHVYTAKDSMRTGTQIQLLFPIGGVDYPAVSRNGLFGQTLYDRRAFADVSLRAIDLRNRELIWAGSLSHKIEDAIPRKMLDDLEGDFLIGRPHRPVMQGFRRWTEPLIAVSVFMGTALLFYFIRSD